MARQALFLLLILFAVPSFSISQPRTGEPGWQTRVSRKEIAETLTNNDIVRMVRAELQADIIKSKIDASNPNFDLSTEGLLKLREAGVPNDVIRSMMRHAHILRPGVLSQSDRKTLYPPGRPVLRRGSKGSANASGGTDAPHRDKPVQSPSENADVKRPIIEYGSPNELRGVKTLFVSAGADLQSRRLILTHIHKKLPHLLLAPNAKSADVVLAFMNSAQELTLFYSVYGTTAQSGSLHTTGSMNSTTINTGATSSTYGTTSTRGTYSTRKSGQAMVVPQKLYYEKGIGAVAKFIKPNRIRLLMVEQRTTMWFRPPSVRFAGAFVTAYKKANPNWKELVKRVK